MPARLIVVLLLLRGFLASSVAAEQFAQVGSSVGQFARMPVDARGEAMGLATTVNPTGPTAFWWNPAPLPESSRVMASYTVWEHPVEGFHWRPFALRASWRNLTFGYLWGRFRVDPLLVRTAYEPEGNGTYIDVGSDLHQLGCAADLGPWLGDGGSPWTWTVGANVRYLRETVGDFTTSAWDADLGSSLAWTALDDAASSLRLHGTAMVRNVFRGSFDGYESSAPLPRYYHLGLGLELGHGSSWQGGRLVTGTVAYTWRRDWELLQSGYDSEHIGAEVAVGPVALRAGHRTRGAFPGEGWSWGAGLRYRFRAWRGIRAAVDYAELDTDDLFDGRRLDRWTFTAGVDLP